MAVLALSVVALVSTSARPQQPEPGRAGGGRGRGGGGRGARGGDVLVPTALISERGLTANDFPTLRSTTGDVYVWQDVHNLGFLTNNLIVITSAGVLVADGQGSPEAVRKLVEAVGLLTRQPIKYVVVCSEHGDHTGGNEAFPETATFISSPATQASVARAAKADGNGRKTRMPTETVADRRILKMGGTEIHILNNGRSHTGGDLQVYLPQEKVLFTSETFSHRIFPSMANAYPTEWIETLKKVQQIDATFVVPGHGFLDPAPTMRSEIAEFQKALEYVVGEVRRIRGSGVSAEEGLKQVEWGPYRGWSMAERNGPPAFRRIYDDLDGKLK